ncbi:hypothetical protein [Pontibacter sp. H249]
MKIKVVLSLLLNNTSLKLYRKYTFPYTTPTEFTEEETILLEQM